MNAPNETCPLGNELNALLLITLLANGSVLIIVWTTLESHHKCHHGLNSISLPSIVEWSYPPGFNESSNQIALNLSRANNPVYLTIPVINWQNTKQMNTNIANLNNTNSVCGFSFPKAKNKAVLNTIDTKTKIKHIAYHNGP